MQVKLIQLTPKALEFIGECAAICYDAKTDVESNVKRAVKCAGAGHLATLRFAHATFNVSGISRACSHQFVRSKHLDFLQRSQRYCNEGTTKFVHKISDDYMEDHFEDCRRYYDYLIKRGVPKGEARYVLPEGTTTELNVVGNLQAWKDFIALRNTKEAQWEIREVAQAIEALLHEQLSEIF